MESDLWGKLSRLCTQNLTFEDWCFSFSISCLPPVTHPEECCETFGDECQQPPPSVPSFSLDGWDSLPLVQHIKPWLCSIFALNWDFCSRPGSSLCGDINFYCSFTLARKLSRLSEQALANSLQLFKVSHHSELSQRL